MLFRYIFGYGLWYWNYFFAKENSLNIPKSNDIIPIQGLRGFTIYKELHFKKDDKYKDLWILTDGSGMATDDAVNTLTPYTFIVIKAILYDDNRYYVIARADQNEDYFEIRDLFSSLKPLVLKKNVIV